MRTFFILATIILCLFSMREKIKYENLKQEYIKVIEQKKVLEQKKKQPDDIVQKYESLNSEYRKLVVRYNELYGWFKCHK